jgi:hypothetical protein
VTVEAARNDPNGRKRSRREARMDGEPEPQVLSVVVAVALVLRVFPSKGWQR